MPVLSEIPTATFAPILPIKAVCDDLITMQSFPPRCPGHRWLAFASKGSISAEGLGECRKAAEMVARRRLYAKLKSIVQKETNEREEFDAKVGDRWDGLS